jgi:hypothetical protein
VDELGSGGTFEALPTPLGSLTELLLPPAFPGPAGTPLTPVVPAPAEPALGVPVGLPEVAPAADPPADPPAPCARAATGSIRQAAAAIAIRFDFFDIGFLHMVDGGKRASRTVCSCSKPWPRCCFKIVVYARDGWKWGAVRCDVGPSFLDFDAHGLDCDPTTPQFYPLQEQRSHPRTAGKEKSVAE